MPPDCRGGGVNRGAFVRHSPHIFTSLAPELARTDINDGSAETGGLDDAAGAVAYQHRRVAEKAEIDASQVEADAKLVSGAPSPTRSAPAGKTGDLFAPPPQAALAKGVASLPVEFTKTGVKPITRGVGRV